MKKKALIKLIDTYIRQLQEIRSDINSMITEDTADLTQCSNEAAAKYIVAMLKDRKTTEITEVFDEVAIRLNLLGIDTSKSLVKAMNNTCPARQLYFNDIERLMQESDYKYEISMPENSKIGAVKKLAVRGGKSGYFIFAYYFDNCDRLISFNINSTFLNY